MKSEFLLVAKELMETEKRAMSARELVDLADQQQLFSDKVAGQTPAQTMKSKLSVHIRRLGSSSIFIRTAPGKFYLRSLLEGSEQQLFEAKPLRPPSSEERVLVYPMKLLDRLTTWQGIGAETQGRPETLLSRLEPSYIPRFDVERDDRFTQIVTYIMVTKGDTVLAYKRGTYSRVDKSLKGAFCVGFGGHVIDEDVDLFSKSTIGLYRCVARELNEELSLPRRDRERLEQGEGLRVLGLLNDDSSDVGRRHLAVVMQYEVGDPDDWSTPIRGEKAITQLHWMDSRQSERVLLWNFEYWSQLCLLRFFRHLVSTESAFRLIRKRPLQPPHLLCVIGPVGSGKTSATQLLKQRYGYKEINSGQIVAALLRIPPVPITSRATFQAKAWRFISKPDGPTRLARRILNAAGSESSGRILIDGVRQRETLRQLRLQRPDLRVGMIFIQTPVNIAFKFYEDRKKGSLSFEEFLEARTAPVESEVDQLIEEADAIVYNWTGESAYRRAIQRLMAHLNIVEVR